jgi:photosynthetic reaction center cytochrome c subunit
MKKMVWQNWKLAVLLAAGACGSAGILSHAQQPQATPPSDQPKTAEQQFKNIQVLKNIPADRLIPSMQFITASLGVDCEFCHVERQMEKDDKKAKQTARKMISMMLGIDKTSFEGELEVTCYTCHRGSPHPVAVPILSADAAKPAGNFHEEHVHEGEGEDHEDQAAKLPSVDQILDKYLAAVGGADALMKIKTRVLRGTIDAMGSQYPIDIYAEAPDKRISISHPHSGPSVTAFNGQVGWLSTPGGIHPMSAQEREAARIDAELYFPARIRALYKELHVGLGEEVAGRQTILVSARPEFKSSQFLPARPTARPALSLYFDQENGLLLRLVRFAETPLGQNPTQIDYGDYRETGGVKIPYRWTLTRPNGSFTIRVDKVEQNVPIDEKLFVPPPSEPAAK